MNPFEDISTINDNTNTDLEDTPIYIRLECLGRKKKTFVSGWNIPEEQMKEHIKTIKKKNGCNGTIKEVSNETNTGHEKVLYFQGDQTEYINQYLITHSIDPNNIHIKG